MNLCFQTITLLLAITYYEVNGEGLSEKEKQEIVNAHNHFRRIVDPIATNMLIMVSSTICNSEFHYNYSYPNAEME